MWFLAVSYNRAPLLRRRGGVCVLQLRVSVCWSVFGNPQGGGWLCLCLCLFTGRLLSASQHLCGCLCAPAFPVAVQALEVDALGTVCNALAHPAMCPSNQGETCSGRILTGGG